MIGAVFYTTASATILGLVAIMSTSAAAYTAAMQSVGADTPVSGITVGMIILGIVSGFGGLFMAARYVLSIGMMLGRWKDALDDAVKFAEVVKALEGRIAHAEGSIAALDETATDVRALQRWREHIVDPSLVRSGATLRQDILDEYAG